jgi:hypothetical protein
MHLAALHVPQARSVGYRRSCGDVNRTRFRADMTDTPVLLLSAAALAHLDKQTCWVQVFSATARRCELRLTSELCQSQVAF